MGNQGRTASPSWRGWEKAEEEDWLTLHVPLGTKSLAGARIHQALQPQHVFVDSWEYSSPFLFRQTPVPTQDPAQASVGAAFSADPGSKNHSSVSAATTTGFLPTGANHGLPGEQRIWYTVDSQQNLPTHASVRRPWWPNCSPRGFLCT